MNKLILVTGGSSSGKTYLAKELKKIFGNNLFFFSQDHFYKPKGNPKRNYDQPSAFDFKKQDQALSELLENKETFLPTYDFTIHDVVGAKQVRPQKIIVFEGLFVFKSKFAKKADLKIFVDTPSDTRLSRRIMRDVKERGRNIESIINRWKKDVQPSYKKYISLEKQNADVVIPWSKINKKSLHSLATTISHLGESIQDILHDK